MDHQTWTKEPTMTRTPINPDADFDAAAYRLPGHVEGLRMNDPMTLASVFAVLASPFPTHDDGVKTDEFRHTGHPPVWPNYIDNPRH